MRRNPARSHHYSDLTGNKRDQTRGSGPTTNNNHKAHLTSPCLAELP